MLRTLLTFTILSCLILSCKKDLIHWQQAEQLDTHTTTDRLNRIFFVDDSLGFVVGGNRFDNSTILTTHDGGITWNYNTVPQAPKGLYGMTSAPDGILYIAGFEGTLLSSADRGASWQFHQLWPLPIKDLAFFNETRAMVIGGISFNQGVRFYLNDRFEAIPFDSLGYEMNDIEMTDGRRGYIAAYGAILKTEDSGYTWQFGDVHDDNFTAVHAYGNGEAWACGYNGSIVRTSDGGNTWQRMRNGNDILKPEYHLTDILFLNQNNGFAVGENGLVIYTDDGGRHWMEFDRFTNAHLRSIVALKDKSLLVCGDHGTLYRLFPQYLN